MCFANQYDILFIDISLHTTINPIPPLIIKTTRLVARKKAKRVNKDKEIMRRTIPSKLYFLRDKACDKRIHTKRLFLIHQNNIYYTIFPHSVPRCFAAIKIK